MAVSFAKPASDGHCITRAPGARASGFSATPPSGVFEPADPSQPPPLLLPGPRPLESLLLQPQLPTIKEVSDQRNSGLPGSAYLLAEEVVERRGERPGGI